MTHPRISYSAGRAVAISAPGRWLLLDLKPDEPVVARCWDVLSKAGGVEEVLDTLLSHGVRSVPAFALLVHQESNLRSVVRGRGGVQIEGAEARTVQAPESTVWADQVHAATDSAFTLFLGDTATVGAGLPTAAGVLLADSIQIDFRAETAAWDTAATVDEPELPDGLGAAEVVVQVARGEATGSPDVVEVNDEQQPERELEPEAADVVDESPDDSAERASYDHLFGATGRAVAPEDIEAPLPGDVPLATAPEETAIWRTVSVPVSDPTPPQGAGSGSLIDSVPWGTGSPSVASLGAVPVPVAAALPAPSIDADNDNDNERTVLRSALFGSSQASDSIGPKVFAVRCPAGHLTPPHSDTCRVCRTPVPEQASFEVSRPSLGNLRLSTGETVSIDRGVLIGRSPSVGDRTGEHPHLIKVASPENDVSRNHIEIQVEAWNVFVTDLGSTNGTTVKLPGESPVRLRFGDPHLLEDGAEIVLADQVSCVFEVTN